MAPTIQKLSQEKKAGAQEGWDGANGSFSIANMLKTSGRIIPGGMFNGACGGLLRKNQKKKKKKRETLTKERKEERSSSVAECCGRGLRVAASLGSTKSSSSPRCAGEAGHGGKQSAHLGFPCR